MLQNIYPIRYFFVTPSRERWPPKAKIAPSPHEVRVTLLNNNPIIIKQKNIKFVVFVFNDMLVVIFYSKNAV